MRLFLKQTSKVEVKDLQFVKILDWAWTTPKKDSPVQSTFEETGSHGGTIHVSLTDMTTNVGASLITTIHVKTIVLVALYTYLLQI